MNWSVQWSVAINGRDMTSLWQNYLISVSVTDKAGVSSDSACLVLDDTGGELALPTGGESVVIAISGQVVFEGVVEKPTSSGNRSSGQRLSITAKGFDTSGKAKEVQGFHLDDATLEEFLTRAAQSAGFSISVDPELAAIEREYWSAEHESFLALGERLAKQYGGTFKLRGDKAVLAKKGSARSPSGQGLPVIEARRDGNLIDWNITPKDPRRVFSGGKARYFDRESGEVKTEAVSFEATDGVGENVLRLAEATQSDAKQTLAARGRESERESGGGTIVLDLEPTARAECLVNLLGVRAGIDGQYVAESVTQSADRSGGATTSLSVKHSKN